MSDRPNAGGKRRVALVYYSFSSFVRQDYEILSKYFEVRRVRYRSPKDAVNILGAVLKSDVSFSWFAGGHAFLAVLFSKTFGKKSVVVVGGYDVAYVPQMDYGQYTHGWLKRKYADFALKNADLVLAVSKFTEAEVLDRAKPKKIEVVYNAIDLNKFRPESESGNTIRGNVVLTVASGFKDAIRLKGLDAFVKAASYLPGAKFVILGLSDDDIAALDRIRTSNNVELHGYVDRDLLITYYRKSKVYCQLSYRESFGVALAEAMACGCVPVVTYRGALPEVVGRIGYFVPYGDPIRAADAIEKALSSGKEAVARDRIKNNFGLELRENRMINLIANLLRHAEIEED